MTRPYRTPLEHLEDCISLVGELVERQVTMHWESGLLPRIKDQFSGTFVSGTEVTALLRGGLPPSPEGERLIGDLDVAIAAHEQRIEARLDQAHQAGQTMPFDHLRRAFSLTPTEQRVIWVLVAIEVSARLRQLMRYLVNESSRIHADVGLLEMLVYGTRETRDLMVTELSPTSRLFHYRVLEPIGGRRAQDDAPYLLRTLKVHPRIIELVHGVVRLDREVTEYGQLMSSLPSHDVLVLPDSLKRQTTQLIRNALDTATMGGVAQAIVLSGAEGSGRKSLLYGAAQAVGCQLLRISCDRLPAETQDLQRVVRALLREAALFRAIPLFERIDLLSGDLEGGRSDRAVIVDRELADFLGPVVGTCAHRDTRPLALSRGLVIVDVPMPTEAARAELWRRALGGAGAGFDVDRAAGRYPITGGMIERSAESALARARGRAGDPELSDEDLHAGVRATLDTKLSALGVRITWRQTWKDLVIPEDSLHEIREFISRVRHRRRVYEDWGFARKVAKGLGLSALFTGPPGTGKTMVAGIIADELALDLYQIDLSRIVSKYVGETEKNLAGVFDAAEAGHAILLFDEADSLFAKRTEVKSSVDRYANLEVNYLLQRMEAFSGITILTTNLDASIDDAFRRRISFRVDFPMPEADDRERLWRAMLPAEAAIDPGVSFKALATKYEFSGGYIRNAVLRAAFFAAEDDQPIGMKHLQRAAMLEYAAMGKLSA